MASVNKVIIVGNLGKDPELSRTPAGKAVCNLSVGTNRRFTPKGGEPVDETEWHRIVVWDRQAENCAQYLSRGSQVYVEGRLNTRSYEKDGVKKYTTDIVAQTVQFLGGRSGGGSGAGQAPVVAPLVAPLVAPSDDDIPF